MKMLSPLPCAVSMPVVMVTGNMVRGLDEDETSFLDEVSRQQCLVEKQRRDEEKQELLEYRISFSQCDYMLDIKSLSGYRSIFSLIPQFNPSTKSQFSTEFTIYDKNGDSVSATAVVPLRDLQLPGNQIK